MRPIRSARYVTMFHRIEMNVVHMIYQITFIADSVFPESALPNTESTILRTCNTCVSFCDGTRKPSFNQRPSRRIICVPIGHRPNRMQMIRQDTNCDRSDVSRKNNRSIRFTQFVNAINQHRRSTINQRQRKEIRATRDEIASIHHHVRIVSRNPVARGSEARPGIFYRTVVVKCLRRRSREPGRASLLRATR
jgi:hypothetical protein